jgi:NAD(P)-dependent dehydrogenase (short-subunit alcohol dehydrogenase family)
MTTSTKPTKDISVPDQTGKIVVVTGGNSGIGLEAARRLAQAGARVVIAVRNPAKGEAAVEDIRAGHPSGEVSAESVDLSSLASIRHFAAVMTKREQPIDILINNAGIMAVPKRDETEDGFELQIGTNFLGHFALTGLLLPVLQRADTPRVVTISSNAAKFGRINLSDLQSERRYGAWRAYGQSKLADLIFAFELQRRSVANGWGVTSNAAHPGSTHTNLQATGPNHGTGKHGNGMIGILMRFPGVSQDAAAGALPTLYAATSPDAVGSGYYGPNGFQELNGVPAPASVPRRAIDAATASELWAQAEVLTGVRFPEG